MGLDHGLSFVMIPDRQMITYRLTSNQLAIDSLEPLFIAISNSYTQMVGPPRLDPAHRLLSSTHEKARTKAG